MMVIGGWLASTAAIVFLLPKFGKAATVLFGPNTYVVVVLYEASLPTANCCRRPRYNRRRRFFFSSKRVRDRLSSRIDWAFSLTMRANSVST